MGALVVFSAGAARAAPPLLFFYPPPVQAADGRSIASPAALSLAQVTRDVPALPELAGVVVMLTWAQLCPQEHVCNVSIIRQAADYWHAKGRKIVLGVATVGFPTVPVAVPGGFVGAVAAPGGQAPALQTATPGWVLRQVTTYRAETRVLDGRDPRAWAVVEFPSYADPRFAGLVDRLVQVLAQFDGHPGIAQIRISTGLMSEDNPSPAGGRWLIPGYGDADWIGFCRTMSGIYRAHLRRTQLEFDLGVVALAWQRGDAEVKHAADAFVADLIAHDTFLAFDGLSSRTEDDLAHSGQSPQALPRIMHYLRQSVAAGQAVGLEAMQPLTAARMQDIDAIADAVVSLPAARLVLFPFAAAELDREHGGHSPSDARALQWVAAQPTGQRFPAQVHRLMARIGYPG